jgi:hypothetical protein
VVALYFTTKSPPEIFITAKEIGKPSLKEVEKIANLFLTAINISLNGLAKKQRSVLLL